ncbi:MAG: sigma-E factor negative regulatory protein [Burkholderiales bacterium]|nr:sigma-E factor negative regulatory protein [Burkholderiales bacterium]
MKHETDDSGTLISALVDGQLGAERLAGMLAEMESSPEMMSTWHVYQLIGDVMRSEDLASGPHDLEFFMRLQSKLALEPVPAAQLPRMEMSAVTHSANEEVFRWKWLAGVTVTVLVSVIGVGLWNYSSSPQLQASGAAPPGPTVTQAVNVRQEDQVMLRDPQLDALMAAHQQLGGYSALQMPSGFLRNATFDRSSR